jgi:integrase
MGHSRDTAEKNARYNSGQHVTARAAQKPRIMATIEKRTTGTGGLVYRVKVRIRGYPDQTATFERLTDARKWATQTEAAIREGRHFKHAEANKRTVAEMLDRYTQDVLPTKGKQKNTQVHQVDYWRTELGPYLLADLTADRIAKARDKLAKSKTRRGPMQPATVVRYLAALSHVCTVAMKEWGWLDDNPCRKVTKPKEPRGRVRFLSDDERTRLLDACRQSSNPFLYTAVVLALSTGARRMEILSLTWSQVDLDRRVAVLHDTKNGERRVLPLAGPALSLLRERAKVRPTDTDLLFPGNTRRKADGTLGEIKPVDLVFSFQNAMKEAGIENFRWHDLRHSAASYLAMNGASLAEIAEVLGHKTLAMVKRYAHMSEPHTAGVVERMNKAIFGEGE